MELFLQNFENAWLHPISETILGSFCQIDFADPLPLYLLHPILIFRKLEQNYIYFNANVVRSSLTLLGFFFPPLFHLLRATFKSASVLQTQD